MMNNEKRIILELLKFDDDSKSLEHIQRDANWINILGFLTYHRVAGLAYKKMEKLNVRNFDYPVYLTTCMINQAQAIRTIEQNKWINIISTELNKENIKYAFLKGAILNNTIFNLGSRCSNDIDILVQKKDIQLVTKILNKIGFVQGKYNYKTKTIEKFTQNEIEKSILTRGETAPFVRKTSRDDIEVIDVDINFSIDWQPNNNDIVNDFLDNRMKIKKNDNIPIYSLNHYHNIIELCVHLFKDSTLIDILKKKKVLDLYKFVDIYYYLKKYNNEINMDILYNEIEKYNLENYIYFALKYVTQLFPDSNTTELKILLTKIKNDKILNTIFNQHDSNIKMETEVELIDRIFIYDIIKNYKKVDKNEENN